MDSTLRKAAVRAETIRVLYIDADTSAADELATTLEQHNDGFDVTTAPPERGLERLQREEFDCIVSRYQLTGTDGVRLFETVREQRNTSPFILYAKTDAEGVAEQALEAGVSGYVRGDQPAVLANRIESEVDSYRERRQVEETKSALEEIRDGVAIFDEEGTFQYINDAYASFYGYRPEELVGGGWEQLYPESERERYRSTIIPILESEGGWIGECECLHRDGFQFRSTHSISQLEDGGHVCVIHSGSVAASED